VTRVCLLIMKPGNVKSGPAPVKAAFRDKRYTIPILSVDLFEKVHETRLWSFSQMIVPKYEGRMPQGSTFTGAFTFEGQTQFGLFEAKAVKIDSAKQLLGAEFTWISKPGFELLEKLSKNRKPDTPPIEIPKMRVTFAYPTINWSLSGALLKNYWGGLADGEPFNGLIRIEKAPESGVFSGTTIRFNQERQTLAIKFTSLSSETFELLETSMKKNPSGF
jgi:hypothetical protein